MFRPEDYTPIPDNRHGVAAGTVLLPTDKVITVAGGSSLAFVREQGGDADTFIFLLGMREARGPLEDTITFLEGVFLSERGVGFHATWGLEQLLREIDLGGWRVVPTAEVLATWARKVEERMNLGDAPG